MKNLPILTFSHCGASLFHAPLVPHIAAFDPVSLYPAPQVKSHLDPTDIPLLQDTVIPDWSCKLDQVEQATPKDCLQIEKIFQLVNSCYITYNFMY